MANTIPRVRYGAEDRSHSQQQAYLIPESAVTPTTDQRHRVARPIRELARGPEPHQTSSPIQNSSTSTTGLQEHSLRINGLRNQGGFLSASLSGPVAQWTEYRASNTVRSN